MNIASAGRVVGSGPNFDFNARRPRLPEAAAVNRLSRGIFLEAYLRIEAYPNGPVGPTYPGAVRLPALDYVYFDPKVDDLSLGYQTGPPVLGTQAEKEAYYAPDLGTAANALVKKVRVLEEDFLYANGLVSVEGLWDDMDDDVPALHLGGQMYPNLERIRVTLLGLYEPFLPAHFASTFAVHYCTASDEVWIAEIEEEEEEEEKYRYCDAPNRRGPRNLVIRIDIDHSEKVEEDDDSEKDEADEEDEEDDEGEEGEDIKDAEDDEDVEDVEGVEEVEDWRKEHDWQPVLSLTAIESLFDWQVSPEMQYRLVWEMAERTITERLWKHQPAAPTVAVAAPAGNVHLLSLPATTATAGNNNTNSTTAIAGNNNNSTTATAGNNNTNSATAIAGNNNTNSATAIATAGNNNNSTTATAGNNNTNSTTAPTTDDN
ncbi:hypothetical protein CTA1_6564 [Colletotrichum tanaceti]|uniref:Uncharacterized protein n=1 Tax=Colletotrichum tanaceti TaxID=1306861 RepID=A0A4V6DFS1_9PEZI|nr:hypothetical protein CTA1_6564 [Colletotrichum tanaceti]